MRSEGFYVNEKFTDTSCDRTSENWWRYAAVCWSANCTRSRDMRVESIYGTWVHDFSSTSTSAHVDYTTGSTIRIPLYIPGRISFFFSLSFWYWFILQSLYSLGHVFWVILPSPFFFNKNTCHSLFVTLLSSLCLCADVLHRSDKRRRTVTLESRISFVIHYKPCCGVRHKILLISFCRCFLFSVSRTRLEKAVGVWTWLPWISVNSAPAYTCVCLSVHAFNITDWFIYGYSTS